MELCPVTNRECPVLDILKKLDVIQVTSTNGARSKENELEHAQSEIINEAQTMYCADTVCGVEALGTAAAIKMLAISEVEGD
jgi:hypothetical protein